MTFFEVAAGRSLYYEHSAPSAPDGRTFVFVNALTGNTETWQHAAIGPALRVAGHGTLCYNFRGQAESGFAGPEDAQPAVIVADLVALLDHLGPARPVMVGLSIGGLFAAQAHLAGAAADALVFINTLRKPGLRLDWINRAMVAAATLGGSQLVMEMNLPHLVNPEMLAGARETASFAGYSPADPADGLFQLLAQSLATDWDFPYERLALPVLSLTGVYDRVFRVDADKAELAARIADHREVIFDNAGHLIPVERPAAFTAALLDFAGQL